MVAAVAAVLTAEHEDAAVVSPGPPPEGAVAAIRAHRVTTLLADRAAEVGFDDDAVAQLAAERHDDVASGMGVIAHTREVSHALGGAGVDHLFVKGVAMASMAGRGAATRGSGDIDVWVRPSDLAVVTEALAEAGWSRRSDVAGLPDVGSGWRWRLLQRVGHELPLEHPKRSDVDLHWRLTPEASELTFGFEEAWRSSVPLDELGDGIRGLCPSHALAHAASHARKEHFSIVRQCVDVVDLVRVCGVDEAAALAARDRNVALALGVVNPLAPWLGLPAVAGRRPARLAAEIRAELGSTHWELASLQSQRGLRRLPVRLLRESWLVRSAPRVTAAVGHLARSVVPLRLLTDDAPVRHRR